MCTNCSSEPATSAHILECPGLTKQDLADDLLLVLDLLKVYDVMDLQQQQQHSGYEVNVYTCSLKNVG
ncbi:hypothetical protein TNCV_1763081 [Trichonephila clavipes]|nr:hypothetical protein TNCV_1763081 [Trichonephila clavipes]